MAPGLHLTTLHVREDVKSRKSGLLGKAASMACKIERLASGEHSVVISLCGRIQLEHVSSIKELIAQEKGEIVLDLSEVTLVDREVVDLFARCALKGIEITNCPAFLHEWIAKERQLIAGESADKAPGATDRAEDL